LFLTYLSLYFFSLFSSFWNFKHTKDTKVIVLKAIFQAELGGERLHHSPSLGSGSSSINIMKSLLRSCISFSCKNPFVAGKTGCYRLDGYQHKPEDTKMILILQWL